MTRSQKIGFVKRVKRQGKDEEVNTHVDDIILPYIEGCLIT